jgi:hypothetical protein
MGHRRGVYSVLVDNPEGRRHGRRWEDIINLCLQEVECGGMDWKELALVVIFI